MTSILIDTARNALGSAFLFQSPGTVVIARQADEVLPALQQIENYVESGKYAAGFFSYELGYVLEPRLRPLLPQDLEIPLIWFAIFDEAEKLADVQVMDYLKESRKYQIADVSFDLDRENYKKAFTQAQHNIQAGDIYQLNLTFKSRFGFDGDPRALYRDLKLKQQMNHGALIETDSFSIVSASPELFLTIDGDKAVSAPMKGTAGRGLTSDEDQKIISDLQNDLKSRAENLMIVDLMRNDLGRLSKIGGVTVSDLFKIETYPTLHQMVSYVYGDLEPDLKLQDIVRALYPPGSITGAPKVRAMELISELEVSQRGVYTGTIGMLLPQRKAPRQAWFNVAIRTITIRPDGTGEIGIGSGVVSDSIAEDEYNECLLKMKFLNDPITEFELIETYSYSPDKGYLYYTHHLNRLEKSASHFGFSFDTEKIENALSAKTEEMGNKFHRVRLLLSHNGNLTITATPTEPTNPNSVMRYVISDKHTSKNNVYLYHKTTNRNFYDDEHAEMTQKYKCDEVVFLNEEGQVTEGSRTNIFIEHDGILYTPPIECGLLAGTMRADLLENKSVQEKIITLEDLQTADQVYLGNSVRGLLRAELITK